jgi:hypothetical protein
VLAVPCLWELYPGIALQVRKKNGNTSVMVAARTSQGDTVQYRNNKQYNTQKKNIIAEYYNVTAQYRTENIMIPK